MRSTRERIISFLSEHPEGADDKELARALDLKYPQHANQICRRLAEQGIVERPVIGGKIRNFLKGTRKDTNQIAEEYLFIPNKDEPWNSEHNVLAAVAKYLKEQGYSIIRIADTRRREKGKDMEAKSQAGILWITAKAYPKGTERTRSQNQAGHYFKDAFFDIPVWRGENKDAKLAIALPNHKL
ncbi:MAG: MarR family transcriptional regulator [Actinobacteria bacterium]|nr:MAG: MarR family transcriptional regulator [Actinomycetota bacterium]